jgi:hypothetical protein
MVLMADEKKQGEKTSARGAWVVVDDQGDVLVVESSEVKAFRAAQPFRALVIFWPFGKPKGDVITPTVLQRGAAG